MHLPHSSHLPFQVINFDHSFIEGVHRFQVFLMKQFNMVYLGFVFDLDDTIDRLHQVNRVRHEFELRYRAEFEANTALKGTLEDKMCIIEEKDGKIDIVGQWNKEQNAKIEHLLATIN